jgi:hypothetical protein
MSSSDLPASGSFDVVDLSGPSSGVVGRHRCVDCRATSPATETNFTLISARYGWRLHREADPVTGEWTFEWRCPECWSTFKGRPTTARGQR